MDDVEHISRKGSAVPLSWFPVPEETELPEDLGPLQEGAGEDRVRPKRLQGLQLPPRAPARLVRPLQAVARAHPEPRCGGAGDDRGRRLDGERLPLLPRRPRRRAARGVGRSDTGRQGNPGSSSRRPRREAPHGDPGLRRQGHGEPLECTPQDLEHLEGFGLTEEEVWDVVEIASMYNFTNRMSLACGMIPNEEYHALAR